MSNLSESVKKKKYAVSKISGFVWSCRPELKSFGNRSIDNRESPFVLGLFYLRLLIAKTIFEKGLLSKYLRIAGSELVSEKLTRVVAASVFVDYNQ